MTIAPNLNSGIAAGKKRVCQIRPGVLLLCGNIAPASGPFLRTLPLISTAGKYVQNTSAKKILQN